MRLQNIVKPVTTKIRNIKKPAAEVIGHYNKPIEENCVKAKKSFTQKISANFRKILNYVSSKLILIEKADIKRLSKLAPEQFLIESQKIIAKSKGYNPEFMAPFAMQPLGNKKISMLYIPSSNQIIVNTDRKLKSGAKMFSDLCHEYEHMRQNIQVLRTPSIRDKAISHYVKTQAQVGVDNFINVYKDVKKEQLPSLKEALGESYAYVESFIKARDTGKEALTDWLTNATKNDANIIKQQWENIKNKIIDNYGEIKDGSKEAERAKEYLKCFTSDASPVSFKKNTTINEIEAYFTSIANFYNYLLKKLF